MARRHSQSRVWAALALAAFLASCGETELPPFGDLDSPVAIAIHQPNGMAFIASQGGDELRVFDIPEQAFLQAPAFSFPLSIPTVKTPRLLAAGDRFVFVVSGADGSVGFVDTVVPRGALGPRSVDGEDGTPVTVQPPIIPTAAASLVSPHGFADEGSLGDQLLLVGLDGDGLGGGLAVIRPPVEGGSGQLTLSLDLPGIFPKGIALEQGFVTEGDEIPDCRTIAVADGRVAEGHVPGVWLSKVLVEQDGELSIDPFDPVDKIEIEVEVTLPDGSTERRVAPVRSVAFAPVPPNTRLREAVEADPCETRSGRLFAILDAEYCSGALECPNFVAIDLPSGEIARDAVLGAPAAYRLPAVPLDLISLEGPITVAGALTEAVDVVDGRTVRVNRNAGPINGLTLVTSSDGGVTYVAGGFGTRLLGPAPTERRAADPVFLVDNNSGVPGVGEAIRRTDRRGISLPRLEFPLGARPRNESWSAGFETPLPGLGAVGTQGSMRGDAFTLPESRRNQGFLSPVPVVASSDPEEADRLVPMLPSLQGGCDGFPIVEVSSDGRTVIVDREAPGFENPEECLAANLSLAVLPPRDRPWTLSGSVSGFAGRISADRERTTSIVFGSRILFQFRPPEEEVERGATFTWSTSTGFSFFRQNQGNLLLPASIASYGVRPPSQWRVVVAFSGSDAITVWNPARRPRSDERFLFR